MYIPDTKGAKRKMESRKGLERLHSALNRSMSAHDIMELVGIDESNVMECLEEAHGRALEINPRALDIPEDSDPHETFLLVAALFCACWQQDKTSTLDIAYQMVSARPMFMAADLGGGRIRMSFSKMGCASAHLLYEVIYVSSLASSKSWERRESFSIS